MRDQGVAFRVWGSGLRIQGSGFRIQGSGFRVQGSGVGKRTGFRVSKCEAVPRRAENSYLSLIVLVSLNSRLKSNKEVEDGPGFVSPRWKRVMRRS